jgi:integrase
MPLSRYLEDWLDTVDLLPITRKGYSSILTRFVIPEIGNLKVTQISARTISDLLSHLQSKGVGQATLGQVKASLGSAFKKLVQTGEIPANPTHGLQLRQSHADLDSVLEPEEFKQIVKHLPNKETQLFARFLVASGCRFGEATEVRVKDINFKTGELFVQRRVSDLGKSHTKRFLVVDATKSGYKRSLMLSKALLQEISEHVSTKALSKEDLLFPRSILLTKGKLEPSLGAKPYQKPFGKGGKQFKHGTPYAYTHGGCRCGECLQSIREYRQKAKPYQKQRRFIDQTSHIPRDVWRTIWNRAIAKSGIGWYPRTHDLRHANATQLLKNGVDVHEVKERLGHRSIKTTERYLHRIRNQQSKAGEIANDFLE